MLSYKMMGINIGLNRYDNFLEQICSLSVAKYTNDLSSPKLFPWKKQQIQDGSLCWPY